MSSYLTMRNFGLLAGVAAVVWFALAWGPEHVIIVQISDSQNGLVVTSQGNCGAEKGCRKMKKNKSASLEIRLKGRGWLRKFKCDEDHHNWELTKIELAGKHTDAAPLPKPAAAEWGILNAVDQQVMDDFNADAYGDVTFTAIGSKKRKIRIFDYNGTDKPKGSPGTEPYNIWYRLTATCNGLNPIVSDPRFRNTGNR